jgi:DNA polymerase III subunit gamma/tau
MSYISFYRKWRPQAFSEVIGQEHIIKTLQNAISKNRLVHGYMFCGPKGTGKTSIARIFAKAINCVNGPAVEPCNICDNCISITAGSNVDIVEIDGASNRGIENIRDLREKIKFLPVFLRKKIYIIDEAHQITDAAFNALLKTLEEPPEHVIFVMATTDPNKVIKTIMSRCQRFDFEPISLAGLRQRLKDIASSEDIDITDSALSIVAKYSDGSLRDAEGILEQLSSFNNGRITVDDVSSILGIIDQDMLFELTNIILEKNINQGLLFVSRLFSTSFSLNNFVSEFLEHLYSLYVIKNYENPADILDMPDDFKENYFNQAGLFTAPQLENLIDLFSGLLAQIKESENPKTFFKAAVIKALHTEAIKSGQEVKSRQEIKNLKISGRDVSQSKNEPVEVNPGSKSDVEFSVPKKMMAETFGAAGNVSAIEKPEQKKMAETENALVGETAGVPPDKVVLKESVKKAPDKAAAETLNYKESFKAEPDKVPAKDTTEKKEFERSEKDIFPQDKEIPSHDKNSSSLGKNISLPDKNSSDSRLNVLKSPDGAFKEGLMSDTKKTSGSFSELIPEIWETVLVKIKVKSVPLQAVFREVKRFKVQGNKVFFSLEPKNHWHKAELNKADNRALIQELLKSLTGEKFEVTFDFINDENINESTDIANPAKKIRTTGDSAKGNKDATVLYESSSNDSGPEIDADKNTSISKKSQDGKDPIESSDAYGYFEEKFKVKEK